MAQLLDVGDFGGIDADTDDLLSACFQEHEAYAQARDHHRFLIIGRKGSGKTAIFKKMVGEQRFDSFAFGHIFEDYPWHHHNKQATSGIPEEARYVHSWRYLMLVTVSKMLLNQDSSQPWCADASVPLKKLERFLVDSYGSKDPDVTQLFAPDRRLRISSTLGIPGTQLGVGVSLERLPVEELPRVVQEVNRSVTDAVVSALNPEHDYYVCFDQLDLRFQPGDQQYSHQLIGLIVAARQLSQTAKEQGKRFSVVVFLRDDIFQTLRFEDKNKIAENQMSRIEWDTPRTKWKLKDLMERRFGEVLGINPGGSWEQVFDETQEMPHRQTKYQHILDRTFGRPRDIIKFSNEVLASYKARVGSGSGRFENEDVAAAREAYSDYLLRELDDEIFKHHPAYRDYVELVKSIGTLHFSASQFTAVCKRRSDLVPDGKLPVDVLRALFDFSVIGYLKVGGGSGGSGYVWSYLGPRARFDEAAVSFRVHLGFKEVLDLKHGGRKAEGQ